jgi:hypothetical protein
MNTKNVLITIASMIVIMGITTLVPMLQQHQTNAASLRQHSNLLNNCFSSNTCRDSNVDQGILGNDNQATGFGDLSDTTINTTTGNAATSGPAGAKGDKGDPGAQGAVGPAGPPRTQVVIERNGAIVAVRANSIGQSIAMCNTGELATGGGYEIRTYDPAVPPVVIISRALSGNVGWEVLIDTQRGSSFRSFAECSSLAP